MLGDLGMYRMYLACEKSSVSNRMLRWKILKIFRVDNQSCLVAGPVSGARRSAVDSSVYVIV